MYTPKQTQELINLRASLEKLEAAQFDAGHIQKLRELLRFHEHRYYVLNDPLIADHEYDQLFKKLQAAEAAHPDYITADSPTQRLFSGLIKDFPKVQHLVPMLSLDNSYNEADLLDFDRRARELTKLAEIEYCVEPKFDGASISLIYENDLLVRGSTRGDGTVGDDITTNIRQIRSIPLSAPFSRYGIRQVEIRGEVLMNLYNFKLYNDRLEEQGSARLANPRNAAAGSLRIKDPGIVGNRKLEAFVYHISEYNLQRGTQVPEGLLSHSASLELLREMGFRSPTKEMMVITGIDAVIRYCDEFEKGRDDLPYEIDGMVIKVNNFDLQDRLGMTTHHPRWAIAYKFKARQATSRLASVGFQVGRTGAITPVAKIDPVQVSGVTVTSISVHNEEYIREKDLRIGDTILIERSGDVIPQVVKSFPELRSGSEQPVLFPSHCPVCATALYKPEGEAVWRCNNLNCPAQVVERIIHFTSKDAMDIRGLGDALVRRFYELGFLQDLPGIYTLPFEKFKGLEGFGEKSIQNLRSSIESSKQQPLHRLIYGLGLRYVGETTARVLAAGVTRLLEFRDRSVEELQQLEDIGPKVAASIHDFFSNPQNITLLERLEAVGLSLKNEKKELHSAGNLQGQSFLFTGTLQTLKRSEAEEIVEQNGGSILGSVSSKLNYLVVGEDAGSKLEKAKKISTIKIISEAEFVRMIGS